MRKHGLHATNSERHLARGGLVRDGLEALIEEGKSIAEIAAAVDRSKATVRHWLKKYSLTTDPTAQRERRREARRAQLKTVIEKCRRHDYTEHYLDRNGYYRCKRCRSESVIRRRRKVRQVLVSEAGGSCRLCGYHRYVGALEFHHLDPSEKSFGLSLRGLTPSVATLRAEARKCVLLCSNCHAEVEAGVRSISGVAPLGGPG
jgi:transposase